MKHPDSEVRGTSSPPVAVVGVGMRLPGGINSLSGLWAALVAGTDTVSAVTPDRFPVEHFVVPGEPRPGKSYTAAAALVGDVAGFDADYFGISPREAARMDPQHRLLLECAVEAFDDAAIDPASLMGTNAAVVMGLNTHDYESLLDRAPRSRGGAIVGATSAFGAANRLSYFFDLRGPSHAVDTACSSSLTALHLAAEELRTGRSRTALAGAANLIIGPQVHVGASQARMLSPTGRCHPFSAAADGYVRGEGAGVVLLKLLSDAVADGDRIHAVVLSSVLNDDGRTPGFTMPGVIAQSEMLELAYAQAGVCPSDVAYVEAHGTGTLAGDPVECEALGRVLGQPRNGTALPIGSVKSNLGHLEAAAGMAGLFKAILVLQNGHIPATLHASPLNPGIDFEGLGLQPVVAAQPLRPAGRPVAGVNSFGVGGANGHAVLTLPDTPGAAVPRASSGHEHAVPIMVSGHTQEALRSAEAAMAGYLTGLDESQVPLRDVGFTTVRRRGHRSFRTAVMARDAAGAARALRAAAEGTLGEAVSSESVQRGRIGFVFTGNGAQWAGMGQQLLAADPVFAHEVESMNRELEPLLGWSVTQEMRSPEPGRWSRTDVAQPMLFVLQCALVASLRRRGVRPHAVTGHSVGEVAAAWCAGVLDRRTACLVIAQRSKAQQTTSGTGRMAAVALGPDRAARLLQELGLAERVVVAAVNTGKDTTLSGEARALEAVGEECAGQDVFFRDVGLDFAFHSPAMDGTRESLLAGLRGMKTCQEQVVPVVSSVTGATVPAAAMGDEYWWRNIREPVLFAQAVDCLITEHDCDVLLEVGPHPALRGYLRSIAAGCEEPVRVFPTLTRISADPAALDAVTAGLVATGAELGAEHWFPEGGRVVDLPAYPWQRERHWIGEPDWWLDTGRAAAGGGRSSHPLLGHRVPATAPTWRQEQTAGWLVDHRVASSVLMPAAAYLDMILSAAREMDDEPYELVNVSLDAALALPQDPQDEPVHTTSTLREEGTFSLASERADTDDVVRHARGRWRRLAMEQPSPLKLAEIEGRIPAGTTVEEFYRQCAELELHYGPAFRTVASVRTGERETLAAVRAVPGAGDIAPYTACPPVLDGVLQSSVPMIVAATGTTEAYLPTGFEAVRLFRPLPSQVWAHSRLRTATPTEAVLDITVAGPDGAVVCELVGFRTRRRAAPAGQGMALTVERMRALPWPGPASEASPLPHPERIVERLAEDLDRITSASDLGAVRELQDRAIELQSHFAAEAMRVILETGSDRGATDPAKDGGFDLEDLLAAGMDEAFGRRARFLMDMAVRNGPLTALPDGRYRLGSPPQPEALFTALLETARGHLAYLHTLAACGRRLPQLLTGAEDPLRMLFDAPDRLADRFYRSFPQQAHANSAFTTYLSALLADWPQDRPLRVLEVGAGTGSLSSLALPLLPRECTHYTFTDVSQSFFDDARTRFADYDFIDYRTYDLDADPAGQGLPLGGYDIVLASNALHTAADLPAAMRSVQALLAEKGQLIALEMHSNEHTACLFGMLDTYWRNTDTELRPAGLQVSRSQWTAVMEGAGLTAVHTLGGAGLEEVASVIVAARPSLPARTARTDEDQAADVTEPECILAWATKPERPKGPVTDFTGLLSDVLAPSTATPTVHEPPEDGRGWERLMPPEGSCHVVLLCDAMDPPNAEAATRQAAEACGRLSGFARACAAGEVASRFTVWLVVCSLESRPDSALGPVGAALWGAARTLTNEHPDLAVRRVHVTGLGSGKAAMDAVAAHLRHAIRHPDDEDELVLTPHGRFVPRARQLGSQSASTPQRTTTRTNASFALRLSRTAGQQYGLDWTHAPIPRPGDEEIVVKVEAAGLNYRDALLANGQLSPPATLRPHASPLGFDGAGTVVSAGSKVTRFVPGDRVAGITVAGSWLASHLVIRADHVFRVPEHMPFAEAATLPLVHTTVHHALHHLAELQKDQAILIHAGTGGLGLAALAYARRVGARTFVTAGTPAKRDLLHVLGADHVLDSRTPRFAEQIRSLTDGRGVDVVLNSLAGDLLQRSLECVAGDGVFIELGKADFHDDRPLPMSVLNGNVSFHSIDVSRWFRDFTAVSPLVERHLRYIEAAVAREEYQALPYTLHDAAGIHEAMVQLQHARHVGKLVVDMSDGAPVDLEEPLLGIDHEGCYLITGGFEGFGAATARHLVARGARHLVLVSRRGPQATPGADGLIADLTAQGARVDGFACDIAQPQAIAGLFGHIRGTGARLAGVIHHAMVLDDAPITELTRERYLKALGPKLTGALLLDQHSRAHDPDLFVLSSSFASLIGNAQQANYCAANASLEDLARRRRQEGLCALAMQWSVIADAGYVHRTGIRDQIETLMGTEAMTTAASLGLLDVTRTLADPVVGPTPVGGLTEALPGLRAPRTAPLLSNTLNDSTGEEDWLTAVRNAGDVDAAHALLEGLIVQKLAKIMHTSPERVPTNRPLNELGVDSLMATELTAHLGRRVGTGVPPATALSASITHLTTHVLRRLRVSVD